MFQQRSWLRDRLDVDGDQIGARLAKLLHIAVRLGNHQMHIQRQTRPTAYGLHDRQPKTQIGHKVAVHDIQMQQLRPGCFTALDFVGQMAKIASQQRWVHQGKPGV